MKNPFRKKEPTPREAFLRTYLDCIAPGVVKFEVDHYIFGSTYRCVWALREYPASTEAQAAMKNTPCMNFSVHAFDFIFSFPLILLPHPRKELLRYRLPSPDLLPCLLPGLFCL